MPISKKNWKQDLQDAGIATAKELREAERQAKRELQAENDLRIQVREAVNKLMEERGIGFNQLCEISGLSRVTVNRIVNGTCNVKLETLNKIAQSLNQKITLSFT